MRITLNRAKDGSMTPGASGLFGQLAAAAKQSGGKVSMSILGGTPDRLGNVKPGAVSKPKKATKKAKSK